MQQKRQVLINALMGVVQVVVTSITLLVVYRYARDAIGTQLFGAWALVFTTVLASNIANLGFATSTVKFVSKYLAHNQTDQVVAVVQTAALSVGAFIGVLALLGYPAFEWLLGVVIEWSLARSPEETAELLPQVYAILPYALVSFWLTSIALVFQSCIDGCHRVDLRGALLSGASIMYLVLVFVLIPRYGLMGLVQAQVAQSGLLVLASWTVLRRLLPSLPWVPWQWSRAKFQEMLGYSINFQVISITMILFEPATKWLVTLFAGLNGLADYEFAYRLVTRLRSVITTAHQALVPTFADLQERDPSQIQHLYKTSFHVVFFLVVVSLPLLVGITPVISELWIGAYEPLFVTFASLLFGGWFLNLLANPAYYAYMGIGTLRWNVVGHIIIGFGSVALGYGLGAAFGGLGVVIAIVISLISGSGFYMVMYQREYRIRVRALIQPKSGMLVLASGAGLALCVGLNTMWTEAMSPLLRLSVLVIAYGITLAIPVWRHPMRERLFKWLPMLVRKRPSGSSDSPDS